MNEKELFKSFNGVTYSDEDIKEYRDLGNMTWEDLATISGAVRGKMGRKGIKECNQIVNSQLEEKEDVMGIIKIRNLKVIKATTVSSILGGTMGYSLDYGIFNTMYFTNRRIFFVDMNVINRPISDSSIKLDDILGIKFTSKEVKVIEDENGSQKIKLYTNRFKLFSLIFPWAWLLFLGILKLGGLNPVKMQAWELFTCILGISFLIGFLGVIKSIQDFIVDRIKIVLKNGYVWDILIASYDYKKCREFLEELSKKY